MNSASREIVPANGTADSTDPPPETDQDSADRTESGRASSASGGAYIDGRFAPSSAPPPDYPPPRAEWHRATLDWYEEDPFVEGARRPRAAA